jgi:site-specific DNA-methyltransferase (cytosine-N4-specific)
LFSKSEQYYYDYESIREPAAEKGKMCNRRTVWQVNTEPFPEAHFATFPEELVRPVVQACARPGDYVLDPFFGAGTVGEVCAKHGRHYHGIELKEEYINIAKKRINQCLQTGRILASIIRISR